MDMYVVLVRKHSYQPGKKPSPDCWDSCMPRSLHIMQDWFPMRYRCLVSLNGWGVSHGRYRDTQVEAGHLYRKTQCNGAWVHCVVVEKRERNVEPESAAHNGSCQQSIWASTISLQQWNGCSPSDVHGRVPMRRLVRLGCKRWPAGLRTRECLLSF